MTELADLADIEAWEKVRDAAERLKDDLHLLDSALHGEEPLWKQIRGIIYNLNHPSLIFPAQHPGQ